MIKHIFSIFLISSFCLTVNASEQSEALFTQHRSSVFQIHLIDNNANQKIALGSGFRVGPEGIVATNYHVISNSVYKKSLYRIEAVDDKNTHHAMLLRSVDVIHDIALLAFDTSNEALPTEYPALSITTRTLPQGEAVFSMGNPLDIGMMIVEGQYNGLKKDTRFAQMIFSGDINAGMSGGPAIDQQGELVGINVASSGNGIGYLVSAKFLNELLLKLPEQKNNDLIKNVGEQLQADQNEFYSALLTHEWKQQMFGELFIPDKIDSTVKCWGNSDDTNERRLDESWINCNASDNIFILDNKYLGSLEYNSAWIKELDLNRFQFYSHIEYENSFGSYSFRELDRHWNKDEVKPFSCKTSFVESGGGTWRMVYCVRAYKLFPGLFDMGLLMVSVDHNDKNLSTEITATGISQENATKLTEKFIRSITWKK